MKMIKYYLLGALILSGMAWWISFWPLKIVAAWAALSLLVVSSAYLFRYPSLFRKREDGSIPFYIRWLFIPFLLGTGAYNSWARKHDKVPPVQRIDENLYLACRLFGKDVEELNKLGVDAILDVTAEFDGLDWSAYQSDFEYLNIPVLDHSSPSDEQLLTAINWIRQQHQKQKCVVVHCALGRGRSVLVVAAYLLACDPGLSIENALERIQSVRTTARLNKHQLKSLARVKDGGHLKFSRRLALIANPVAGGGKWPQEKGLILSLLNPHFEVSVFETTKDKDATVLARKAIEQGAEIAVACGGDGTITEVASACVDNQITLGVIPLGTANALSQVLHGLRSKLVPVSTACETIVGGTEINMDTALCNDRLMLMVAAVGFEEEMIASADREQKNEGGQLAYLKGLWEAITSNQSLSLEVEFDDNQQHTIETPSLVIANAAPVTTALAQGGGEPDLTDGKLDITWLKPQESPDQQVLSLAELVFRDTDGKKDSDRICHTQAKSVRLTLPEQQNYALDGEIQSAKTILIQARPASLRIFSRPKH
ncbi:hypothetical protein DXV75_08505 [Alteromonas aestuariivivens]|uniref:Diacylglycerol kinase n=1 Tax=Alteromonas aestuariivivens TaxID=1938339 RepID=A0A3D8M8U7_9ALTE|nr:diacylglycerol kinase family protein [Alteromonas aestuariivivens]RDV26108.1 hypothetical protein DXV75_08505 [Alteromonas aestuariivivens]